MKTSEMWHEFIVKEVDFGTCGLCANWGTINKETFTPAGHRVVLSNAFCICPNGRASKRKAAREAKRIEKLKSLQG